MEQFIKELRDRHVFVSLDNKNLKIRFNGEKLPEELVKRISERKEQIVEFLTNSGSGWEDGGRPEGGGGPEEKEIGVAALAASYPLSSSQRMLWALSQVGEANRAYNMPGAFVLTGRLDKHALEHAFHQLLERHESLRTVFRADGGKDPRQLILPADVVRNSIGYRDLRNEDQPDEMVKELVTAVFGRPFDLAAGPLVRIYLFQVTEENWVLANVLHHIISDSWSMNIFIAELVKLYMAKVQGLPPLLKPLRIQYKDYAVWHEHQLSGVSLKGHRDYWIRQLSGELPILDLPTDKPRPAIKTYHGATFSGLIDRDVYEKIKAIVKSEGCTLFMGLLAAVNALLYRYTGQEDIIIGSPTAGRDHLDLEDQIGYYVKTLALRTRFQGGAGYLHLLSEVRRVNLDAYEHQVYPLDELMDQLQIRRDMSRSALFDVLIDFHDTRRQDSGDDASGGGLLIASYWAGENRISKFDLSFIFSEMEEGLNLSVEYNSDLFEEESIRRLSGHFSTLLQSIAADPAMPLDRFQYIPAEERKILLDQFGGSVKASPGRGSVAALFAAQAGILPAEPALVYGGKSISYGELMERADGLTDYLRKSFKIKGGDLVGIMLDRSENMVIAILGILRCGAAYVPIDPVYPAARKEYIIRDAGIETLITQVDFIFDLGYYEGNVFAIDVWKEEPDGGDKSEYIDPAPEDLAYVIYTSGSTGDPKGCAITHRSLSHYIKWANGYYFPAPALPRFGLMTSLSFDLTVTSIFCTLTSGGCLTVYEQYLDILQILRDNFSERSGITDIKLTPSHVSLLKGLHISSSSLQRVILGGEKVSSEHVQILRSINPAIEIYNEYGPTEATVGCVVGKLETGGPIRMGRPISDTLIYILTGNDQLCPVNVAGEICIGGAGLAAGYLKKPGLTAQKFVSDPFREGERMYRTGDLGKWLADGNIDYIGRTDDQVKVRGYRIEPGEIEACIRDWQSVESAIVLARPNAGMEMELVAYVVSAGTLQQGALAAHLSKSLPPYMIPDHFVQVESMPLTPNGKIDKRRLPDPGEAALSGGADHIAPRNEVEIKLVRLWKDILGKEKIGVRDNFFLLGGHSLKAIKLVSQIHKEFDVKIELKDLFANTVLEDQALLIRQSGKNAFAPIAVAGVCEHYPLSSPQRRLWVLSQFEEVNTAYNIPGAYLFEGYLDPEVLDRSFRKLIGRHEILRTVFREDERGEIRQFILAEDTAGYAIFYKDLRLEEGREEIVKGLVRAMFVEAFDLAQGPLLRAGLYRLEDNKWVFSYVMHHIISDGWSMGIMIGELLALYNAAIQGINIPLPVLRIQYKDYAVWQTDHLDQDALSGHREYWLRQFGDSVPALELTGDRPRPAMKTYNGTIVYKWIGQAAAVAIKQVSLQRQSTLFMGLLAAVKGLLYRYTGQEDIVIGSPVAGREHPDLEDQIGFYVNTLALRTRFSGEMSFAKLLDAVREVVIGAFEHQLYPFDALVKDLNLHRDISRHPLFDVQVIVQEASRSGGQQKLGQLDATGYDEIKKPFSVFDLVFNFDEAPDGLGLSITYNTDIYDEAMVMRLADNLERWLIAIGENQDEPMWQLDFLDPAEKIQLLQSFNDNSLAFPDDMTLVSLFEGQALRVPDHSAVVFGDKSLSYGALNHKADQLAYFLKHTYSIRPDDLVGIMLDRSEKMIIAILAVLKAGGAYVPIDPAYPVARKEYIMQDTGIRVLITQSWYLFDLEHYKGDLFAIDVQLDGLDAVAELPVAVVAPRDLAYVIYTSGSTGQPKGVMIEHAGIINTILSQMRIFAVRGDQRGLQFASLSFDASVSEIFIILGSGATLYVIDEERRKDALLFEEYMNAGRIDLATIPPAFLKLLRTERMPFLEKLITAGEPADPSTAMLFASRGIYFNAYGPTEYSICATVFRLAGEGTGLFSNVPIGKPVYNTAIRILDAHQQLAPIGVTGEICLSGKGLARGYLNRVDLTEGKFVADPFRPGERMYQTGDMGRWLADGNILFTGRRDEQVKIRGIRVEIGEIEHALMRHAAIREVAVVPRPALEGGVSLVAYLVGAEVEGQELNAAAIRDYLKGEVPGYMVPDHYVVLPALPLNTSGKIDKKALPSPVEMGIDPGAVYVEPRNATELALTAIWENVLERTAIGIRDDYFELGGNSLKAMMIIKKVFDAFGVSVPMKVLFGEKNIESIAAFMDLQKGQEDALLYEQDLRDDGLLLDASYNQQIYFSNWKSASDIVVLTYELPDLRVEAFTAAVKGLLERHEMLRTVFDQGEGGIRQRILPADEIDIGIRVEEAPADERAINEIIEREHFREMDLSRPPLFFIRSFRRENGKYLMIVTLHHIITDGYSGGILQDELEKLYAAALKNESAGLGVLPFQYRDFSRWQRSFVQSPTGSEHREYWLRRLEGFSQETKFPRPTGSSSVGMERNIGMERVIGGQLYGALEKFTREQGLTLPVLLLGALNILLYRLTGQDDQTLTATVSGRNSKYYGTLDISGIIGFFANSIFIRNTINGDKSLVDFLYGVQENFVNDLHYDAWPFEKLLQDLPGLEPGLLRNTGFFNYHNYDHYKEIEYFPGDGKEQGILIKVYPMIRAFGFIVTQYGNCLRIQFTINRDNFVQADIKVVMDHYFSILEEMMKAPGQPIGKVKAGRMGKASPANSVIQS